jgi:hypothetical protein
MKLRYLRMDFDLPISFEKIGAFRGAVARKVGSEQVLFHHHLPIESSVDDSKQDVDKPAVVGILTDDIAVVGVITDDIKTQTTNEKTKTKFLYRYPLIQYKRLYGKAAIICLGDAVNEIHRLFEDSDFEIEIGNKKIPLKINRLNLNEYDLEVYQGEKQNYTYSLQNWLALNHENYQEYQNTSSLRKRIELLERILSSHLLNFAKGVGWNVEERFELEIQDLQPHYTMSYKTTKLSAFSLTFQTNLFLPNYIGLGKGSSRGFGMIKFLKNKK